MKNFMKYTNEKDFTRDVEETVKLKKCKYIEAILELCEANDIDPASVVCYISKPITEMIYMEAMNDNIGGIKKYNKKSRKKKS